MSKALPSRLREREYDKDMALLSSRTLMRREEQCVSCLGNCCLDTVTVDLAYDPAFGKAAQKKRGAENF
jgi:hypothetical protein